MAFASIEGPEKHAHLYGIAREFAFHAKRMIIIYSNKLSIYSQ